MRIGRAVAVSAVLAVAGLNVLAACTPQDDADVFSTPEIPEPTPEPEIHCQIVWAMQNTQMATQFDVFVLDAPESAWIAGLSTFGEFTAFYQPGLDVSGNSFPMTILDDRGGAVTSTAAKFTAVLKWNGTDDDAVVEVASVTTATLMVIGTDGEPTEDALGVVDGFAFDGVWSVRDAESVELGTGFVDLVLGSGTSGSAVQLGDLGSFALCYDADGGAAAAHSLHPITAAQRSLQRHRR